MTRSKTPVSVVIPNNGTPDQVRRCMAALDEHLPAGSDVRLADASDEGIGVLESCNRAIEAAEHGDTVAGRASELEQLKGELACVASERDTTTKERDVAREELRKKSEILADMSVRLEALTAKSGTTVNKPTPVIPGADPRLVTHINNLQEQLYAERTNNRRLKGG